MRPLQERCDAVLLHEAIVRCIGVFTRIYNRFMSLTEKQCPATQKTVFLRNHARILCMEMGFIQESIGPSPLPITKSNVPYKDLSVMCCTFFHAEKCVCEMREMLSQITDALS